MKRLGGKWGLTLIALLCLVPATVVASPKHDKGCDDDRHRDCKQVPEGGSGIVYLLAAGATCAGAIVIRSRQTKRNHA